MTTFSRIPEPPSIVHKNSMSQDDVNKIVFDIQEYLFELTRYLESELDKYLYNDLFITQKEIIWQV